MIAPGIRDEQPLRLAVLRRDLGAAARVAAFQSQRDVAVAARGRERDGGRQGDGCERRHTAGDADASSPQSLSIGEKGAARVSAPRRQAG